MNNTQTQEVILNALSDYGVAVLAILGAVLVVGLAYLVFNFGWGSVKKSLTDPAGGKMYMKGGKTYQRIKGKNVELPF